MLQRKAVLFSYFFVEQSDKIVFIWMKTIMQIIQSFLSNR